MSLGLLRGFCKVEESEVLAWRTASSFVAGGLGDESAHLGNNKCGILE